MKNVKKKRILTSKQFVKKIRIVMTPERRETLFHFKDWTKARMGLG